MIRPVWLCALVVLPGALILQAQEPADVIAFSSPANIDFMSGPIAFETDPVTDAPYSADAVTQMVQTLADGNRIIREGKAQISRDSKGRIRREEGMAMLGPFVNAPANGMRNVQISDPSTGTMIMLDMSSKTAHKMPAPPRMLLKHKIAQGGANVDHFETAVPAGVARGVAHGAGGLGGVYMERRVAAFGAMRMADPTIEPLGSQFMEGVTADGTRTTFTIPAGQIGNELPISIVSERWMSPELKVLVMSRQLDPRFGETTYRLTNISRAEPAPELFEIPHDFTVVDPMKNREMFIERKLDVK
jgi:hypothetical protein